MGGEGVRVRAGRGNVLPPFLCGVLAFAFVLYVAWYWLANPAAAAAALPHGVALPICVLLAAYFAHTAWIIGRRVPWCVEINRASLTARFLFHSESVPLARVERYVIVRRGRRALREWIGVYIAGRRRPLVFGSRTFDSRFEELRRGMQEFVGEAERGGG